MVALCIGQPETPPNQVCARDATCVPTTVATSVGLLPRPHQQPPRRIRHAHASECRPSPSPHAFLNTATLEDVTELIEKAGTIKLDSRPLIAMWTHDSWPTMVLHMNAVGHPDHPDFQLHHHATGAYGELLAPAT